VRAKSLSPLIRGGRDLRVLRERAVVDDVAALVRVVGVETVGEEERVDALHVRRDAQDGAHRAIPRAPRGERDATEVRAIRPAALRDRLVEHLEERRERPRFLNASSYAPEPMPRLNARDDRVHARALDVRLLRGGEAVEVDDEIVGAARRVEERRDVEVRATEVRAIRLARELVGVVDLEVVDDARLGRGEGALGGVGRAERSGGQGRHQGDDEATDNPRSEPRTHAVGAAPPCERAAGQAIDIQVPGLPRVRRQ